MMKKIANLALIHNRLWNPTPLPTFTVIMWMKSIIVCIIKMKTTASSVIIMIQILISPYRKMIMIMSHAFYLISHKTIVLFLQILKTVRSVIQDIIYRELNTWFLISFALMILLPPLIISTARYIKIVTIVILVKRDIFCWGNLLINNV